jgi:hypothetical protein
MGRERIGGDFATGKARQSATFRDASIPAGTGEIEFQDRCLKPLGRLFGCPTGILYSDGFASQADARAYRLLTR